MKEAEIVKHEDNVLAVIIRKNIEVENLKFFTPEDYPFQLGVMVHEAGGEIRPHIHKPIKRTINETQEMIMVDYGKVDIDIYTDDGKKLKTVTLGEGDSILFVSGGHGFRFQEKTKMTEVKQGPYNGTDVDKGILKG